MKVLHVIGQVVPGGSEKMTLRVAKEFRMRGDDHRVLSIGEIDRGFIDSVDAAEVPIDQLGAKDRGPSSTLRALRMLADQVDSFGPDLIQGHAWRSSVAAGLVGRLKGVPALATLHRIYYERLEKIGDRALQRLWQGVIVDSVAVKDLLEGQLGIRGSRVTVIPNFVSESLFGIEAEAPAQSPVRILMAAHFTEVKGHRFALEAIAELERTNPGAVRLELLGEGPLLEPCRDLARRLGIEEVVRFHGRSSALRDWLSETQIVVLPSLWEGFGLILAEAMAAGRPAVSFRIGGAAEVIADGETGFLTPPGDVAGLTDALRSLVESYELRARMGEAGRRRAREKFSADRVLDSYFDLYEGVLAR